VVDEAKIRITIDPAQARQELDRIERAAPGQRERRVTGFSPSVAAAAGGATAARNAAARQAGVAPGVTAGGAFAAGGLAGRRFATLVKTAVRAVIAEQAVSKGFPILSETIKEAAGELTEPGSVADEVLKELTKRLDDVERALIDAKSAVVSTAQAGSETASAAYAAALTGNQLSAGQAGDIFSALRKANAIQFESQSILKSQELRLVTRNQGKQIKDSLEELIPQVISVK
jgi:hypothetical protein